MEMRKFLYLVFEDGYAEDYVLVYASTKLEIVSECCKEMNKEMMTIDEFYETHTVNTIDFIGDKAIKEIIFYGNNKEYENEEN